MFPSYGTLLCSLVSVIIIVFIPLCCRTQPPPPPTLNFDRIPKKPDRLKYELIFEKDCGAISHPDAIINECGFCVGADTGLDENYGKDCLGICFGNATIDCMGVCDGDAYMDECSEACLLPETDKFTGLSSNRDCRGLCQNPNGIKDVHGTVSSPNPSQNYLIDQCGLCSLSSPPSFESTSANSPPTSSTPVLASHSLDCHGNCRLPGFTKHQTVCGKCIRQNELLNVIDSCGNCLDQGHPCSCDRDPIRCGCIDQNNCYVIKTLSPLAVPNRAAVNISIVGYFYPYLNQLYCVVRSRTLDTIESFPVQFLHKNKTFIQCTVQLEQSGEYVVGLGFRKDVFITPPKDLLRLYVFDALRVNITSIHPARSHTNESMTRMEIEFIDDSKELPPLPFRCRMIYEIGGTNELTEFGSKPNSCLWKESTKRSQSQVVKIYPTFDGVNLITNGIDHLIEADAPKMFSLTSFISEDSLSIIVNFDKPVDIEMIEGQIRDNSDDYDDEDDGALVMCDYLLQENTIEHLSLFELIGCKWATRIQLIISMHKPFSSDWIEVQIKPNVLSEYKQRYALLNEPMSANVSKLTNSINWWSYEPMIAITGPNQISSCGDFALHGHFSSPRGTAEVDFQWEVSADIELSPDLQHYVAYHGKSTNLLMNSAMLEMNVEYVFTFQAFIQARRQSITATHTVIRLDYETANLAIHSTDMLNNLQLHENDLVVLFGDFKIPECIYPPQLIHLYWKTIDPMVRFPISDISKRQSVIYMIEPYSVPANHSTEFTFNSFLGYNQNQTSMARFRYRALPAQLKANLADGVHRITIGLGSGPLTITSRNELRAKRLVYQWSCHETKSGQPCYFNFASAPVGFQRDPILITRDIQNKPYLILDSKSFMSNNHYLIGLQVFDANNSKISSETEYIELHVVDGVKPQVFVGPVFIKGKHFVPYNTRFSTYVIPSGTDIVIRGNALLNAGIRNVTWESGTFRYPLSWSNKRINDQEIQTELFLHGDTLTSFGTYNFKLQSCSMNDECSESEISLMCAQSSTMCHVNVESYVELEMTLANVEKCSTPPNASPITYQLFWEDENFPTMLPLTVPQLSPVILFAGTPIFAENQLTRLAVKACDRFETCTVHHSQPIRVEWSANLSQSMEQLIEHARKTYKNGDLIVAISYLNAILLKPDMEHYYHHLHRHHRHASDHHESEDLNSNIGMVYEKAINSTIEFSTTALQMPNLILASGHYELILNAISHAIHKTDDFKLRAKLLNLIDRFLEKAEAMNTVPSIKILRIVYANVMNSFVMTEKQKKKFNSTRDDAATTMEQIDQNYLQHVRSTFHKIKRALACRMSLATKIVLVAEHPDANGSGGGGGTLSSLSSTATKTYTAYTEIIHWNNLVDVDIKVQMSANQTISARVHFGPEVRQMFNESWNCGQSMPCSSVIQAITVFPNDNPFPADDRAHKLSPIIDITIHAPKNGHEQHIRGLFKASIFELPVTGNESYGGSSYTTKCHYFDEETQRWRSDDIHPLGIAYNHAGCWSGHLSSFVVLRTVLGLNADYILGVLVACTMGVLIFCMMVVFYVQRKREGVHAIAETAAAAAAASEANAAVESSNNKKSNNNHHTGSHRNSKHRKQDKSTSSINTGTTTTTIVNKASPSPHHRRSAKVAVEVQSKTILVAD